MAGYSVPEELSLVFAKYDLSEVVVHDAGLARYMNLQPVGVPHSSARNANKQFGRSKVNLVERLMNSMMRTEDFTGKKITVYNMVSKAFDIIHRRTKGNPVQILVEALENAGPREEVTRLKFGGISVPKAVDISPSRRLDIALRNVAVGAVKCTYKSAKPMEECLANELILAAKADMNSYAVSKKEEIERVAASAR